MDVIALVLAIAALGLAGGALGVAVAAYIRQE